MLPNHYICWDLRVLVAVNIHIIIQKNTHRKSTSTSSQSINIQLPRLFIITYWCMYMLGVCWNMIGRRINQSDSDQSHIEEINH